MKKDKFDVYGMTCAACSGHVDKAVKGVNGVIDVNVNLLSNSMEVTYDEKTCDINQISIAVDKAGYRANLQGVVNQIKEKDHKLLDD